ncbi:LysR family transcriptional regulator [Tritonibacter horizontis]|uniref:Glycine cleavage system transcriptional activator n=1 Tax=Tritonibacter horizontis TaxID=1768241 RepID=A0A132BS24_9RHOB|nr:LysR family transcriptional regulator [Tritonibacter horizontis]KUP91171.1 glycine cleavage system transcriptional activator [Tritonibacter horizontis]
MKWRDMPTLAALRAFSVFAETGSLQQAGGLLNVSHAAISQHLRALEAHMGVPLLDRSARSLALTAEGEQLAQALTLGFGAIRSAVQDLSVRGVGQPLHVTCTPMFATHWLMPRLAAFRQAFPEVDLVIDPTGEVVQMTPGGIDVALRYGHGNWPGLEADMLFPSPMVVVAAPGLLDGRQVSRPEDLLDLPWLEEIGTHEASVWLRSRGVSDQLRAGRVVLPGNLLMEALRAGQGVAVSVRAFVASDVAAHRLTELFCEEEGRGYHIVHRPGVLRPGARHFVNWLRRERDQKAGN